MPMVIRIRSEFDGTPKFKGRELKHITDKSDELKLASYILGHTNRLVNPCNSANDEYVCRWCRCKWKPVADGRYKKKRKYKYQHHRGCPTRIAIRLLNAAEAAPKGEAGEEG